MIRFLLRQVPGAGGRLWLSPRFHRWGIPIIIFLVAFGLRVVYPISRPLEWSDRAYHFVLAVEDQNWAHTFQRYHPGVTIMWLSGIALHWFAARNGNLTAEQLSGTALTKPGVLVDALQAAVILPALVISLCIALIYPVLSRLAGRKVALAAAFLLAFDPFHVAYSKVIHPDGLLSVFMILSALLLLLYNQEKKWPILILSGCFAGLSFLSKSPSLFLIPYIGLILGTIIVGRWWQSKRTFTRVEWLVQLRNAFITSLVWAFAAALVFVILWPAMWVRPIATVTEVIAGALKHSGNPHPNPVFYNGQIWETDPGIGFYLATIAWKLTSVTLPLVVLGGWVAVRYRRLPRSRPLWAILAYTFFFFLQMSLGQFKQIAYILPLFPALDIIAAFGLVWIVQALRQRPRFQAYTYLSTGLITVALMAQGVIVLLNYPYFGAHYNYLLGGPKEAQHILALQDHGEGLEVAARYLNALPYGQGEIASIYYRSANVFSREFNGQTVIDTVPFARYHVYYVNQLVRGVGDEEWHEQWQSDQQNEPLMTVDIGGITYVWVYGEAPTDPAPNGPIYDVVYQLGEHVRLEQIRLSKTTIHPGDTLNVVLNWQSDGRIQDSYKVFVHLLDSDGQLAAQKDNVPLFGIRPTPTWNAGETLTDIYQVQTDASLPAGIYSLSVGMYHAETIERLPAYDSDGTRLLEDRIFVDSIQVTPQ